MTLFRKVFQNQSQPAKSEDVLDEAELRKAFIECEDGSDPLPLDPFACEKTLFDEAVGQHGECDATDDIPGHLDAENEGEPSHLEMEWFECVEEDLEEFAEDTAGELVDNGASPEDAECDVVHTEAAGEPEVIEQSDAEIAAFLDRAMAAEPPETASDNIPTAEEAASVAEEANDWRLEVVPEHESGDDSDDAATELDVAQFAQQQLAALDPDLGAAQDTPDGSEAPLDLSAADTTGLESVPAPAVGRAGRRAGRVKTRLLGFNHSSDAEDDPFGQAPEATASAQREKFPVGWLVIVEGPGVGHSFSIFTGASMIGRGEDQVIRLDFGDNSISRNNHAAIAYDEEQNKFYIGHGGKSNIIRRNARPVLSTEELHHADLIRIGETTLRFVALCGSDFQWHLTGGTHDGDL